MANYTANLHSSTPERTVSAILFSDHSITISPGSKGECPFCHSPHFSLKKDDILGKCFAPACQRFLTAEYAGRADWLPTVLTAIYHDFHTELLHLNPNQLNALNYVQNDRGIHPSVIADAMLGAVPSTYDVTPHFQPAIQAAEAALQALQQKKKGRPGRDVDRAEKRVLDIQEAQTKLIDCLNHKAGWLAFFYTDTQHRPVAIRLRQPYTKNFASFKPRAAGLFGRELFTPYVSPSHQAMNDILLVVEGEFNALQLQSLAVRYEEATKQTLGYVNCCAVGGVTVADVDTIQAVADHPIVCYDNDVSNAGFALVDALQHVMPVEACTTPETPSDLDSYIETFQPDAIAAWEAVQALLATRQTYDRTYSMTGVEFFDLTITSPKTPAFIPRRLGEALLNREHYRYTAECLWVYQSGVYRPHGEATARADGQALLGDTRQEKYLQEGLRYIEVATRLNGDLPQDDRYITLKNGRLDWATGNLEPHTPEQFTITQLPVEYDPTALCPTFDHYLATTFDPDVWPLIEELLGWCLIPTQRFETAVMLTGEGANGKSVFLDLVSALLGGDNVSNVALQDLEENRFRAAELYGKLANVFADLDARGLQSSSMFKMLTTGDPITTERKHQHAFKFRSYAKLLFSANKIPSSRDRTYAFYRRWVIIPFTRVFDGQNGNPVPDMDLREKLLGELPGVFNRALAGLERLALRNAFTKPMSTADAKEAYIRSNENVRVFAAECVTYDVNNPVAFLEKQTFYTVYQNWCVAYGEKAVSQKALKPVLTQLYPTLKDHRANAKSKWCWLGMAWSVDAQAYF